MSIALVAKKGLTIDNINTIARVKIKVGDWQCRSILSTDRSIGLSMRLVIEIEKDWE